MSLQFAYFYGAEAEQYIFYRIPKTLFSDKRFKGVSMEAKVIYGLMLDRMGLPVRNGWLNNDGRVLPPERTQGIYASETTNREYTF